jgi:hypothetical protein
MGEDVGPALGRPRAAGLVRNGAPIDGGGIARRSGSFEGTGPRRHYV